jgi:hypothetical protein
MGWQVQSRRSEKGKGLKLAIVLTAKSRYRDQKPSLNGPGFFLKCKPGPFKKADNLTLPSLLDFIVSI